MIFLISKVQAIECHQTDSPKYRADNPLCPTFWTPSTDAKVFKLNIQHFNDLYDIEKAAKWLGEIEIQNKFMLKPITVFSGDIMGPSLVSNTMKGDQFVKLMKMFPFDISVPGNHETDYSEDAFKEFIGKNPESPWLLANLWNKPDEMKPKEGEEGVKMGNNYDVIANYDDLKDKMWGGLESYRVIESNGLTIGFFGLIDMAWIKSSAISSTRNDYLIEDFKIAAVRMSKFLANEKQCDLIFAVTHMTNDDDEALLDDKNNLITMILGGHEHMYYFSKRNGRILIKSGSDFNMYSNIRLVISNKEQFSKVMGSAIYDEPKVSIKMTNEESEKNIVSDPTLSDLQKKKYALRHMVIPLKFTNPANNLKLKGLTKLEVYMKRINIGVDGVTINEEMDDYFNNELYPAIKQFMEPVFAFGVDVNATENYVFSQESAIGDFLTQIFRNQYGTDIVLMNAAIVKAETIFAKDQPVRIQEANKMLSRPGIFELVGITGANLKQLFLKIFLKYGSLNGDFPCFDGIIITFLKNKKGDDRISIVDKKKNPLVEDQVYSIAVPHFFYTSNIEFFVDLKDEKKAQLFSEPMKPIEGLRLAYEFVNNPDYLAEYELFSKLFATLYGDELIDIFRKGGETEISAFTADLFTELTKGTVKGKEAKDKIITEQNKIVLGCIKDNKLRQRIMMYTFMPKIQHFVVRAPGVEPKTFKLLSFKPFNKNRLIILDHKFANLLV